MFGIEPIFYMKKNLESTKRYIPPRIKTFTITTRSNILQSSITGYREDGSSSDNNGYGYDME